MENPRTLVVGPIGTNCYILSKNGGGAVVDPGDRFPQIEKALSEEGITPAYILLTHGHFDHIGAVNELQARYGAQVVIGKNDEEMLLDPQKSHGSGERYRVTPDRLVSEGDVINTGALSFSVLETPGHTKGGVCYLCEDMLLSGDTLFQGECGRTDLYGGSYTQLLASLLRLSELPEQTRVFPGHGPASTIERENRQNPYIAKAKTGFSDDDFY